MDQTNSNNQQSLSKKQTDISVLQGQVPELTNEQAWTEPASRETLAEVVALVVILVNPDAEEDRTQALTQFLTTKDYSEAELQYAARELPVDEHLDKKMRYGKPLTPADFDRIIDDVRSLRTAIQASRIGDTRKNRLLREVDELSEDDFGKVGFDSDGNPEYTLTKEARDRIADIDAV